MAEPVAKALSPVTDSSLGFLPPDFEAGMTFKNIGSSGLRQFGGWVREDFLPEFQGRQAARIYREMRDNSSTVGAILFAVIQTMRGSNWRVEPADDTPEAKEKQEWVESLQDDMDHTWQEFLVEALSMLVFGYAPMEMVFKRRAGRKPGADAPTSAYNDGTIGVHRLALRGQDTILKWFFDQNGVVTGLTQQPWIGPLIDIPIQKLLLFRPTFYKGNPEGYSVLRTAYRSYYFEKRLVEQQGICYERMSGIPVLYLPSALIEAAGGTGPDAAKAQTTLNMYKRIVTNMRIDEQMGGIFPSNAYVNRDGTLSSVEMFRFKYEAPPSRVGPDFEAAIERNKLQILSCVLADFIALGHGARGTQALATSKVDLFNEAVSGWLEAMAEEMNRKLLPLLWDVNGWGHDLMPKFEPDMPARVDLDGLSNFLLRLAGAGIMFNDPETTKYLRDAAGMPQLPDDEGEGEGTGVPSDGDTAPTNADPGAVTDPTTAQVVKLVRRNILKNIRRASGRRAEWR